MFRFFCRFLNGWFWLVFLFDLSLGLLCMFNLFDLFAAYRFSFVVCLTLGYLLLDNSVVVIVFVILCFNLLVSYLLLEVVWLRSCLLIG